MRRGRVHIVTTEGPALVQRLAVEDGLAETELSAVCLNGTTTRLPITGAYTYFVRDHLRNLSGKIAYRLDLDHRVDGGNSWMLGAWIAHLLLAEGRLAMSDDPADVAVFASGEVAFSTDSERRVEVRAVGHMSEKVACLAESAAAEAAAGRRVLVVVPRENADEAKVALARLPLSLRNRIAFHAIAETGEARALLAAKGTGAAIGTRARRWRRWVAALGACAVIAAIVVGYLGWQNIQRDWATLWQDGRFLDLARSLDEYFLPIIAEQFRETLAANIAAAEPLALSVSALRPADGGSCAGLRFREGGTTPIEVQPSGSTYRLDGQRSLCGFALQGTGTERTGHVWIMVRLAEADGVREALMPTWQLVADAAAAGPIMLSQELPLYRHDSWAWAVIAIWAPVPSKDVTRLLGADQGTSDSAAFARLEALGLAVIRARIALVQ